MTTRVFSLCSGALLVVPLAIASAAVALNVVACSGNDGASVFPAVEPDAGPAPEDAGSLAPTVDASDAASALPTPCSPAELPATFTPAWHAPNGQHTGQCTTQQMTDFYTSCLTPPIDAQACATYVSANQACSSCLQSDETDATYGPVIWHSNRAFFTLNIPGCLAIVEGNTSKTGCGAAYQAVLECKESVCTACFASANSNFDEFSTCEDNASSECNAYQNVLNETCDPNMHDANDPSSTCVPPSTTAIETVYQTFAPLFCGN